MAQISFTKKYELGDKRILYIDKEERGYHFILYSKDKQVLYEGILKANEEKTIKQILQELFGYFNISESEINEIKPYKGKLSIISENKISEIIEF